MRIPSELFKAPPVAAVAATKHPQAVETFGAAPTEPSINVTVSPEARARSVGAAEERPLDMEKVERLRALVQRGELKIDSARIADRILASEA